jgi:hypothetical protein
MSLTKAIVRHLALLAVAGPLLIVALPARVAAMDLWRDRQHWSGTSQDGEERRERRARHVPEFDPATAGAIATLLVGGAILLARRRKA